MLYSRGLTYVRRHKEVDRNTECGQFFLPVNAPSGRCSPKKGFSSLVYVIVPNTKPHVPHVKQDFRGFSIATLALHKRYTLISQVTAPDTELYFLQPMKLVNTEGSNTRMSLTRTHLVRRLHKLGLGSGIPLAVVGSNPDLLLILAVWNPEQVTWLGVWV